MFYIHDELMHAIDSSLSTHEGHRFEEPEISIIKDIAFSIVYILDPKNLQQRRIYQRLIQEYKELSIFGKIGAIAAIVVFVLGTANGVVDLAHKSLRLYESYRTSSVLPTNPTPQSSVPTPPSASSTASTDKNKTK